MAESIQTAVEESETVSIAALKDLARRMLPHTSMLRELILSEPDFLPREELTVKLKIYSRLLYRELNTGREWRDGHMPS